MNVTTPIIKDPALIPLDKIDVSNPALYQQNVADAYFKRLRQEDPVHYCAESPFGPFWSVTKHKDIIAVDSNHKVFSSQAAISLNDFAMQGGPNGELPMEAFIAMDPPHHDEKRKAVTPAVTPANLARMSGIIRERAARVLDNLPINEEFDWVQRVSIELTTQMLATILDFPFAERQKLTRWSDVASTLPGEGVTETWDEKFREMFACAAAFQKLWQERAAKPPGHDHISMMAHSPATQNMSPQEFLGTLIVLIVGGNDTTRNTMSGGVLAFHENPDEFDKVKANPALVESLVPEIIRWQTPLIYQSRRATTDTEIGGKTIRKGEKVAMWYYSGNRDEEAIDRADRFIVDRAEPRKHVSFGFGIHRCMGNRLAELQLRILWEELLKRFKRIEVVGEPQRLLSNTIRGITSLPVRIHA